MAKHSTKGPYGEKVMYSEKKEATERSLIAPICFFKLVSAAVTVSQTTTTTTTTTTTLLNMINIIILSSSFTHTYTYIWRLYIYNM